MGVHGQADDSAVKAVHDGGKIQFAVCAVDLRDIAQVLAARCSGRKVPLYQIFARCCAWIALCQTMRTLFARQQVIFLT